MRLHSRGHGRVLQDGRPGLSGAPRSHSPLEGGRDFTVWCDTQSGYICKVTNASVITDCNMDIHTFNVGGSYGNKQSQVAIVSSAAVAVP